MLELQTPVSINADQMFALRIGVTEFPGSTVISRDPIQVGDDHIGLINRGHVFEKNAGDPFRTGVGLRFFAIAVRQKGGEPASRAMVSICSSTSAHLR